MNLKSVERNLDRIKDIPLEKLRTELLHFVKVCIEAPSGPDGYPTSASGADRTLGSGARASSDRRELDDLVTDPADEHLDEHGRPTHELQHLPASSSTSVENAATAKRARDEIDMKTNLAVQQVAQAADSLVIALAKMIECRNLQAQVPAASKPECYVLRQRADVYEEARSKTDLGGLLDEPRHVSRWVADFVKANGVLPTREQCRQHARGDRVMISA